MHYSYANKQEKRTRLTSLGHSVYGHDQSLVSGLRASLVFLPLFHKQTKA